MKNLEHSLQTGCVKWFRYQYPQYLIYAIPNGGLRNKVVAAKLKEEGLLAGVPDLHIPVAKKGYHGLFIEMKKNSKTEVKNGSVQDIVMEELRDYGYMCAVAHSFDEFQAIVNDYFKSI
jgi:hypothetical protein